MTQQELAIKLTGAIDTFEKALQEIKDAIANQPNAIPELVAAGEKLDALAKVFDALNPDAPSPPAP